MTIGPSGCGKTKFVENFIVPQLRKLADGAGIDVNIQVLSSDAYRREILGKNLDKTDDRMKYASEGAFKLMEAKFDAVTTWPVSADFVILDATFIGTQNRKLFVEKAKKAHYQLVGFIFNFDDREEYFKYIDDLGHKRLISRQLKRFSKELGEIGRKEFDYFYKIKSKDMINIVDNRDMILEKDISYDLMKRAILPKYDWYFIVGDLHGCLKEFKELLTSIGFEINRRDDGDKIEGMDDTLIILTGDIPDRGDEVAELIDFLAINMDRIKICKGGHDRFLIKNANRKIDDSSPPIDEKEKEKEKLKLKHFNSFMELSHDTVSKFRKIMDGQSNFYIHDHFVVNHAPCENRYIGKFDKESKKKQKRDSYPHREDFASESEYIDATIEHYNFILNDAKKYDPYHIFGHVAVDSPLIIGNKVFLDTGCVYGNKLTGALIGRDGRLHFKSVQSSYPKAADFLFKSNFLRKKDNDVNFKSLEYDDQIDILKFAENKVNFISGTMSPCAANTQEKTLEDMREAFSYYKGKGVEKVILQKKYMGSRANMYLFPKDIEKSYMISRNGYVIRRLDLSSLYEKMLKFFEDKKNEIGGNEILSKSPELIIIDGELLPWSALGKGLIDSHFMTVGKGIESELSLLEATGFEMELEKAIKRYEDSKFISLRKEHKKEDLIKMMGDSKYHQLSSIDSVEWIPLDKQKIAINIYNRQMDIYGKDVNLDMDLSFKPFAILKVVYSGTGDTGDTGESGTGTGEGTTEELFWDYPNDVVFRMVSDDECYIADTENLNGAKEWFNKIVKEGYEGVVIKPLEKVYIQGVAPYMKIRNPDYLSIIYGYDYIIDPKFTNMVEKKSIRFKLNMSIKEFEIGKKMLEVPYSEIGKDNIGYLDLCAQMVVEEKKEKELDPRL